MPPETRSMTESLAALSQSFTELSARTLATEEQQKVFAAQQQAYAVQQANEHAKHAAKFDRIMEMLEAMHGNPIIVGRPEKQPMREETPASQSNPPLLSTPTTYAGSVGQLQLQGGMNQELQSYQPEHDLVKKMVSVSGGIVEGVKLVAVAVDKGSTSSREALKWAIDHVIAKGQSIMLVYVDRSSSTSLPPYEKNELEIRREPDEKVMDVLTPYICFCLLRQVECEPIVLQHIDVAEALRKFILFYGVQTLVLGGVIRHRLVRIFRGVDVQTMLEKDIPIFCKVYRICNGRIKNSKAVSCAGRLACCHVAAEETISPERAAPELEWSAPISVPVSPSVSAPASAPLSRISSTNRPDVLSFREGDISVNHSERPSTDSTFISFYNTLGNRGLSSESMKKKTVKYYGIHSPNESTTCCHLHDHAATKDIEI
ncbi:hypothetical protein QQ045_021912 [Rhodiola kirilowii]